MKLPEKVVIFTDGACRGNPGPSSIGVVISDSHGKTLHEISKKVGVQTNNYAEYVAVIEGLKFCHSHGASHVVVKADSQLMVRQMTGEYKVKSENIIPLHGEVKALVRKFQAVEFIHVMREENKLADQLANDALDS